MDKNTTQAISRVDCTVKNCAYHLGKDDCQAESICVDNKTAMTNDETICGTFQLKKS